MARGDMKITAGNIGVEKEILNRPYQQSGTPMTVDFSDVTTTDADTGVKVVKAGTPIDKDGKPVTATPWTGAIGILLHDVYEENPSGVALHREYINVTEAQDNSGLTYDAALVSAMNLVGNSMIFENPILIGA